MNKLKRSLLLCKKGRFDLLFFNFCEMIGIKHIFLPYPSLLIIEPTNACNLHCPACPTGAGKLKRPKRTMSFDEFKMIIDQVKGYVANINLWNYGEPFLNKELLNMIEYAVSNRIHVTVSTNGEFLKSKEFSLKVVKSGLQHLIICLDGANQETLIKYRKGSTFDTIVAGIRLIIESRKDLNSNIPKIELQFIIMKHNEQQRIIMEQLATQLGVDIYCEKTVRIDFRDPTFQNTANEFLPNDLSLSRYYLEEGGMYALKDKISNYCSSIFQAAVINSDGTVVPCCYDLYSEYIMGNVFEKSFKEIWKSEKYKSLRAQIMNDRKSIPMCRTCSGNSARIHRQIILR
jgi:radical SAM protein with 4Fe4S-binding SPASM domain